MIGVHVRLSTWIEKMFINIHESQIRVSNMHEKYYRKIHIIEIVSLLALTLSDRINAKSQNKIKYTSLSYSQCCKS